MVSKLYLNRIFTKYWHSIIMTNVKKCMYVQVHANIHTCIQTHIYEIWIFLHIFSVFVRLDKQHVQQLRQSVAIAIGIIT